ncbi:MAG: PQQ-binding-like beta-propeller repeat protein [Acidobacteria bacterium]|nr:PQQ-binding-like beta-propeller repeat protein [Acidobacteriota bacterium]
MILLFAVASWRVPLVSQDSGAVHGEINVRTEDLLAPMGANWLSYNGDYSGRRYSALDQINVANVRQLRAEWIFHSRSSDHLEVTPVVVNGTMFVTSANDVFALDAQTGRPVWHYSRPVSEGLIDDASRHLSRGVAVWHNHIYRETDNAHLLCLDARSGNLIWDVAYAEWNRNFGATSAPLVVNDKIIVGTSGGDDGVRGFLAAYEAESGKLAWRFWTIPAPGEFGSNSWPGDLYLHGGGTTWMPGTYDPELKTLYWTTSNPAPDFEGSVRPGDDLYTDCVLALDPETGKLKWYFQFTPHDLFDYDATETPVLITQLYHGQQRKLLVQADRNGFLYVLDRQTGEFLSATRFVQKLNWAEGIDAHGRPIRTQIMPTPNGTKVCPGYAGATNWFAPSYSEQTHLFYFMALEQCQSYFSAPEPQRFETGKEFYSTGVKHIPGEDSQKVLLAFDVSRGNLVWKYAQVGAAHSTGGNTSTAGGLLFFGDDAQAIEAVDARDGRPLWHFNTGQDMSASPMSYAVGGRQYVAIAAGSDVFTFALPQ